MPHLGWMKKHHIIAIVLGWLCASALSVAAKDQFEIPVKGQVVNGWTQPDGTRIAALRLSLAPGWKTYWRSPGDAGISPRFDWSGSRNLKGVAITWPTPEVFLTAGMRTIGYSGDVILPLALAPRTPGAPIRLDVELDIGVCSDVCVPHQMRLTALLDGADTRPTPEIAAALAARPYTASEAGVTSAACRLSPTTDGLQIEAQLGLPSTGGKEVVIIEPGQPGLWSSETDVVRRGGTLMAVGEIVANDGTALALDRSGIRITVLGTDRAVDIKGCTPG